MSKIKHIAVWGLLLLAACQQQIAEVVSDPTEIRLTSGVRTVVASKAAVVDGIPFSAEVCGWQGASAVVDWSVAPMWTSVANILAGSAAVSVDLVPTQMYNDKGLFTVIRAWHPAGKLEGGKVSFDNLVGELDVLLSQSVSGTMTTPIAEPLLFSHLTTQLRFVLAGSWFVEEPILSIVVKGMHLPTGVDLVAGVLVGGEAVDLAVSGAPDTGVVPTAEGAVFGRAVLVLPIEGNRINIDVTTARKSYKDIEVTTTDTQFTAGRAYTVTLTFQGERYISVGSEVGDWPLDSQSQGDLK